MILEVLVTVEAESRGRKAERMERVVTCAAAMMAVWERMPLCNIDYEVLLGLV